MRRMKVLWFMYSRLKNETPTPQYHLMLAVVSQSHDQTILYQSLSTVLYLLSVSLTKSIKNNHHCHLNRVTAKLQIGLLSCTGTQRERERVKELVQKSHLQNVLLVYVYWPYWVDNTGRQTSLGICEHTNTDTDNNQTEKV